MSRDQTAESQALTKPQKLAAAPTRSTTKSDWFTIPTPLRRLFQRFPLVTYPPNELPARSPSGRELPTLYVFLAEQDTLKGLPSFNPACLKWQTFLKLAGVEFRVVSSTNHASPTGALPFLIPASTASDADSQFPLASGKLEQYAIDNGFAKVPEVSSFKLEAYQSLLDHRIRNAWLYTLYLSPENSSLLSSLYIASVSSSVFVRTTILYQLRHAAEAEIIKSTGTPVVNPSALYSAADQAFEALSSALGFEEWFFGNSGPGLFDASVFAYTHLLLDASLDWIDTRLRYSVEKFPNLVRHRNRILGRCWESEG